MRRPTVARVSRGDDGGLQAPCEHRSLLLGQALNPSRRKAKLGTTSQQTKMRNALEKHLTSVPAAAFAAAGAPPRDGGGGGRLRRGQRRRQDSPRAAACGAATRNGPAAAGDGTPGVSRASRSRRRSRSGLRATPKNTYAEDRGFEVRRRDARDVVCATADEQGRARGPRGEDEVRGRTSGRP